MQTTQETGVSVPDNPTRHETGYVSPTRLNTWLTCPLKYKLRYLDGLTEPSSPSLFLGKHVHLGLEYFYRRLQNDEPVTKADVARHMIESWDEAVFSEGLSFNTCDEEQSLKQQSIRLVETYLDQHAPAEGRPIAVESRLKCRLIDPLSGVDLGISLLGFVDLILETPAGFVIVDFKTAARSSAPLDITHEIQLSCYAYAFRKIFGIKEHELQIRSLVKTKSPKVQTHRYPPRNAAHFRRLFAVIRAYLDAVRRLQFVFRPSWTCSMCSFREEQCRLWTGE